MHVLNPKARTDKLVDQLSGCEKEINMSPRSISIIRDKWLYTGIFLLDLDNKGSTTGAICLISSKHH